MIFEKLDELVEKRKKFILKMYKEKNYDISIKSENGLYTIEELNDSWLLEKKIKKDIIEYRIVMGIVSSLGIIMLLVLLRGALEYIIYGGK